MVGLSHIYLCYVNCEGTHSQLGIQKLTSWPYQCYCHCRGPVGHVQVARVLSPPLQWTLNIEYIDSWYGITFYKIHFCGINLKEQFSTTYGDRRPSEAQKFEAKTAKCKCWVLHLHLHKSLPNYSEYKNVKFSSLITNSRRHDKNNNTDTTDQDIYGYLSPWLIL